MRQKHHADTYVTSLVTASNTTVQGISNHSLPATSERTLIEFLIEYDWDKYQPNRDRLELLQQATETKWSSGGVVTLMMPSHTTGEHPPNIRIFCEYTLPGYIRRQPV